MGLCHKSYLLFGLRSIYTLIQMAAKNWCFTLNNWNDIDEVKLDTMFLHGHFNYIVWGREMAQTGTPHLQGYVQLKKKLRLNQVRQLISPRAHLEISRGSPDMAARYCRFFLDDVIEQVKKIMILLKRV